MNTDELSERLKKVVRELSSIENDDERFLLSIEEASQLCDMKRKLRRMIERIDNEKGCECEKVCSKC